MDGLQVSLATSRVLYGRRLPVFFTCSGGNPVRLRHPDLDTRIRRAMRARLAANKAESHGHHRLPLRDSRSRPANTCTPRHATSSRCSANLDPTRAVSFSHPMFQDQPPRRSCFFVYSDPSKFIHHNWPKFARRGSCLAVVVLPPANCSGALMPIPGPAPARLAQFQAVSLDTSRVLYGRRLPVLFTCSGGNPTRLRHWLAAHSQYLHATSFPMFC